VTSKKSRSARHVHVATTNAARHVHNRNAARLVFDFRHRDHVSPYLIQLHWLAVTLRVQFKLCTLMHAIHNKKSLSCLSDAVYRLWQQQLLVAVFDRLPLRTMSCRVHFPSSAIGPSHMQVPLTGTAFQSTFVASPHWQTLEDI